MAVLLGIALQAGAVPSYIGFAGGAFLQGPQAGATVPDLTGLTTGAANTALVAVGLISGNVSSSCSVVTSGLIISQNPAAGAVATLGSGVDMVTSTGVACAPIRRSRMSMGIGNGMGK